MKGKRLRVVAPPADSPNPLAASQVVGGGIERATRRIRAGGWVALSTSVIGTRELKDIDSVDIPTPLGVRRYRVAALTSNYGWPAGSIVMNSKDFEAVFGKKSASAISIRLKPGTRLETDTYAIRRSLGRNSSLSVRTTDEMMRIRSASVTQGLARLRQISTMVLIAAMLSIVAAMFAAVWQRRERLASLRAMGMYRGELYRTLVAETGLIVVLGGVAGLAYGIYCQYFASRWSELVNGYHSPYEPAIGLGLITLVEALVLSSMATVGPAYLASRISPRGNRLS